ncbi:MAG: hypothetical protein R6U98_30695, partial [Pirellulaceae bacterium]
MSGELNFVAESKCPTKTKRSRLLNSSIHGLLILTVCSFSVVNAAEPDIQIADFKQDPLPSEWQVEGYAFGTRSPGPERQQAAKTTPNQRQYRFGKLISPEFRIQRDGIAMELGGVYHPAKCCVALVVDGTDVRRVSPGEVEGPLTCMDVRALRGKRARLEVRDEHFNGW